MRRQFRSTWPVRAVRTALRVLVVLLILVLGFTSIAALVLAIAGAFSALSGDDTGSFAAVAAGTAVLTAALTWLIYWLAGRSTRSGVRRTVDTVDGVMSVIEMLSALAYLVVTPLRLLGAVARGVVRLFD